MENKMDDNKTVLDAENNDEIVKEEIHYKEMSPTRMVVRRFFRSRLSLVGVIMLAALFAFSFIGPPIMHMFGYQWSETETDLTGAVKRATKELGIMIAESEEFKTLKEAEEIQLAVALFCCIVACLVMLGGLFLC